MLAGLGGGGLKSLKCRGVAYNKCYIATDRYSQVSEFLKRVLRREGIQQSYNLKKKIIITYSTCKSIAIKDQMFQLKIASL